MNLKPGSIVEWANPPGVSVVLKVEELDYWVNIVFLLPSGSLAELRELWHLVDEEFTVL